MSNRILILPSWYPTAHSSAGAFYREQAKFLIEKGFDIKILIPRQIHTKSHIYYRLRHGIGLSRHQLSNKVYKQDPETLSFTVVLQNNWTLNKKIKNLRIGYLKAFEQLTSTGWLPDIIHVQSFNKACVGANAIYLKYKIPFVVIEHSPFLINNFKAPIKNEVVIAAKNALKMAGVSKFQSQNLKTGLKINNVETVYNLIDESKFNTEPIEKSTNEFVIVSILRLESYKDPLTFFKAVTLFIENNPNIEVKVKVVGIPSLSDLSKLKGVDDKLLEGLMKYKSHFIFIKPNNHSEVLTLIKSSNVLISTSLYESFGLSVREALMSFTPVISTLSGGVQESVDDDTCILVKTGDYKSISQGIQSIFESSIRFDFEKAIQNIQKQSGREVFYKRMSEFYGFNI